jgi:hypothetical protein
VTPLVIIALVTELAKAFNLLLESVPVEQRRAQSLAWWHLTWPGMRWLLKLLGVSEDALHQIEEQMKGALPS